MTDRTFHAEPADEADTCPICGQPIQAGDEVVDVYGDLCHAECLAATGEDHWEAGIGLWGDDWLYDDGGC